MDTTQPTFQEFLAREHFWKNKPYSKKIWQAYIDVSSYILLHKQKNIAKETDARNIFNLLKELEQDKTFEPDNEESHECQLYVLFRFGEYIKSLYPNRHK